MKKKKLTLLQLRVSSFKTTENSSLSQTVKGGRPTAERCIVDTIDPTTLDITLVVSCQDTPLVQTLPVDCG